MCRPVMLRPVLLLAVLSSSLFAGCVFPGLLSAPGVCLDPADAQPDPRPDLYVLSEEGIRRLKGSDDYSVEKTQFHSSEPYGVVARNGSVFAVWADRLAKYDLDLRSTTAHHGTFGGLAVRDDVVYVSGKGSLKTFDTGLKPLATKHFEAGTEKVSHDVIACPPHALLLDNVVQPVYLYQVDASDPSKLRTLDEDKRDCVCHLTTHWIDPERSEWYVLESGGGHGTSYQSVHTYELGGGLVETTKTFSGSYTDMGSGGGFESDSDGWYVSAVVPSDPPLAVGWKDDRYSIGTLDFQADRLTLKDPIDLQVEELPQSHRTWVDLHDTLVAVTIGEELRLVDLSTGKVLHASSLPFEGRVFPVAIGR